MQYRFRFCWILTSGKHSGFNDIVATDIKTAFNSLIDIVIADHPSGRVGTVSIVEVEEVSQSNS